MLLDLIKRALPVLGGYYGTKLMINKLGPMIPGVSSLGSFSGPVLSAGAVLGLNWATNKFSFARKYRSEIMLGAGLNLLDSLITAFAPASIKSMIGMSDYVAVGEYVNAMGEYLDDDIAMNNYIAVGASEELGVDEALGLEEELGVDEALGDAQPAAWDYGGLPGGIAGSPGFSKQVPGQAFNRRVPQRSFQRPVPNASSEFDNPGQLYVGSFSGGFGN